MAKIPNYLDKLDDNVCIFGISQILKKSQSLAGLSNLDAAKRFHVSTDFYYNQLYSRKSISIGFLKKFSREIDNSIFDQIYSIPGLQFTARSKPVTLPTELTPDLAYFYGYLLGDGCLTSDKKCINFADEYIEQIVKINNLSIALFGFSGLIYPKISVNALKPCFSVEIKSVVLNSFFHSVFGINRGIKANLHIPESIMQDELSLRHFLAGVFDADGTLPKDPWHSKQLFIDVTMKDRSFIEEVNQQLNRLGIETLRIYERNSASRFVLSSKTYEIRVRRKPSLLRFLKTVGFLHPNKAIRAEKMIRLLESGPVAQSG